MKPPIALGEIIAALADVPAHHSRHSRIYSLLDKLARQALSESRLAFTEGARENLGCFGEIELPYHKMGAVDSLDLFGLDELIIFAFYWVNRNRYRSAADIGANLGLHSMLMSRCGWSVTAYEPDPSHAALLRRNLLVNGCTAVSLVEAAVPVNSGAMEFVRVIGNTTSSHLAGAKSNPYGELERFSVRVESIESIMPCVDFIKMDAEGQEKEIILSTQAAHWRKTDVIVEIGSSENAATIHEHLKKIRINAFAQKLGWARVAAVEDMPTSYKEGSLFISSQPVIVWDEK